MGRHDTDAVDRRRHDERCQAPRLGCARRITHGGQARRRRRSPWRSAQGHQGDGETGVRDEERRRVQEPVGDGGALIRIALANIAYRATPEASVARVCETSALAAAERAAVVCFPECYVPGYRTPDRAVPPPDARFLERAWFTIADAARAANIAVG